MIPHQGQYSQNPIRRGGSKLMQTQKLCRICPIQLLPRCSRYSRRLVRPSSEHGSGLRRNVARLPTPKRHPPGISKEEWYVPRVQTRCIRLCGLCGSARLHQALHSLMTSSLIVHSNKGKLHRHQLKWFCKAEICRASKTECYKHRCVFSETPPP